MSTTPPRPSTPFMQRYTGYLRGILRWPEMDTLWQNLREQADDAWYLYAVGEAPPSAPVTLAQLLTFLDEVNALIRRDHDEAYCGIIYCDDPAQPTLVKIFDPHNLGSSCGPGFGHAILPGWIISRDPPDDLKAAFPQPGNRQRWWQKLFG